MLPIKKRIKIFMTLNDIEIASIIVFLLIAVLAVSIIFSGIINSANEITSGVIIRKCFSPAEIHKSGDIFYSYPEEYLFTIIGEKNEKEVSYTFEVTEDEYNHYKIGDFYER